MIDSIVQNLFFRRLGIFLFAFFLVSFDHPAWISAFSGVGTIVGLSLFWWQLGKIESRRARFFLSLVWFTSVQAILLSWMTSMRYMGPMIFLVYLGLCLGVGIQFSLLSAFIRSRMGKRQMLALSGLWVLFEWSRLFFMCGFTWNPIGLSLSSFSSSLQCAGVFGVFGLSFWVIFSALLGFSALCHPSRKTIAFWGICLVLPYALGFCQKRIVEAFFLPNPKKYRALLVQSAMFPEQRDYDPKHPSAYIPALEQWKRALTLIESQKDLDLIVFPEGAFSMGAHTKGLFLEQTAEVLPSLFFPPFKKDYAHFSMGRWRLGNPFFLQTLANWKNARVIAGLEDRDEGGRYNAAFHFTPQKTAYERYEKQILVPIGEYIPLRFFPALSEFIAEEFGIYSSFEKGRAPKVFQGDVPLGISMCLEETFGSLTRKLRLLGAEVFINLTNDVWFPNSRLPMQHFYHGRVRAVENGIPLLRSANTGFTCGVDCFGRVIDALPLSEKTPGALLIELPLQSYPTLYTLWGDGGILFLSLAFLLGFRRYPQTVRKSDKTLV